MVKRGSSQGRNWKGRPRRVASFQLLPVTASFGRGCQFRKLTRRPFSISSEPSHGLGAVPVTPNRMRTETAAAGDAAGCACENSRPPRHAIVAASAGARTAQVIMTRFIAAQIITCRDGAGQLFGVAMSLLSEELAGQNIVSIRLKRERPDAVAEHDSLERRRGHENARPGAGGFGARGGLIKLQVQRAVGAYGIGSGAVHPLQAARPEDRFSQLERTVSTEVDDTDRRVRSGV